MNILTTKKPKIEKHTSIFQSMMENYRKSTSKTIAERRAKISLKSNILDELQHVKNRENFSDEDYLINEIKFQNHLKDENKELNHNSENISSIRNKKEYMAKITKDIFFYYKYQINRKNNNLENKKQTININNINKKKRIQSPIYSVKSIASAKKSSKSCRKSVAKNLILPLINKGYLQYKTPYKNYYEEDIKSEKNDRIIQSGRRRIANYLNYEKNDFNTIDAENLLKRMKHNKNNLFYKLKLPLLTNKINSEISKVKMISKNISRNINHFSTEGQLAIENGKNRVKFMDNLMI